MNRFENAGMREVGIRRRQHDLGVAGEIEAARVSRPWLVIDTRRSSTSSSVDTTISVRVSSRPSTRRKIARSSAKVTSNSSASRPTG